MPLDIPPSQLSQVRTLLSDPTIDCYLIVGTESSLAWEIAGAVEIDLPPLSVIRIQSRDDAAEWLRGHPDAIGVIFGFGPTPKEWLKRSQAEDKDIVAEQINAAR